MSTLRQLLFFDSSRLDSQALVQTAGGGNRRASEQLQSDLRPLDAAGTPRSSTPAASVRPARARVIVAFVPRHGGRRASAGRHRSWKQCDGEPLRLGKRSRQAGARSGLVPDCSPFARVNTRSAPPGIGRARQRKQKKPMQRCLLAEGAPSENWPLPRASAFIIIALFRVKTAETDLCCRPAAHLP